MRLEMCFFYRRAFSAARLCFTMSRKLLKPHTHYTYLSKVLLGSLSSFPTCWSTSTSKSKSHLSSNLLPAPSSSSFSSASFALVVFLFSICASDEKNDMIKFSNKLPVRWEREKEVKNLSMVESSSAGSSMKSPPPLQHGTQQESWAENKSCTTQQKHCCISSRGCSWWSLQHRHLTKVALEEKSNSGPTHRHDKYERALEQSHQIQYQQICPHNMVALYFTIIPAAKWRSSQCTPKLICPTRQESEEKVQIEGI